ncbi:MAG: hypothetical protein JST26_11815 [Bacteroidetes bacterium]|nr:hypothetical protein [Bacteroidota bacterium]
MCISLSAVAQEKTINLDKDKPASNREILSKHKVMLIPFENRMYMSEIDQLINKETKLSAKQIKAAFRDGLDDQLYKKLKSRMGVVSLLDDTAKTKKDLENIYQYLAYDYQKVPNQANYSPPKNEKEQKGIEKGQIVVETNSDARFMNAKIKNATLVPFLTGKYKTDLYVFVNQLEIRSANPALNYDLNADNPRKIIVHYTVYTSDAKEINSGIAETTFPQNINNPTKIVNSYFSVIAETIAARVEKALLPKPQH